MTKYRVHAWWDRPGAARPGETDLGEVWCRLYDTATLDGPEAVASYLRSHPDAENGTVHEVVIREGLEVLVEPHWAERTIAGWLVGPGAGQESLSRLAKR